MSTNYSRTYLVSAATTTAVTVVPSSRAFATAARHNSSGIRSERGIVLATSAPDRVEGSHTPSAVDPRRAGVGGDIADGVTRRDGVLCSSGQHGIVGTFSGLVLAEVSASIPTLGGGVLGVNGCAPHGESPSVSVVDDLDALVAATPATIGEPDDGIATGHARGCLNDSLDALALPRRVDGPPTDDRLDCAPSVARLSLNVEGCSAHDLGSFRPFAVSTVCTLTVDTSTPSLERPA